MHAQNTHTLAFSVQHTKKSLYAQ